MVHKLKFQWLHEVRLFYVVTLQWLKPFNTKFNASTHLNWCTKSFCDSQMASDYHCVLTLGVISTWQRNDLVARCMWFALNSYEFEAWQIPQIENRLNGSGFPINLWLIVATLIHSLLHHIWHDKFKLINDFYRKICVLDSTASASTPCVLSNYRYRIGNPLKSHSNAIDFETSIYLIQAY